MDLEQILSHHKGCPELLIELFRCIAVIRAVFDPEYGRSLGSHPDIVVNASPQDVACVSLVRVIIVDLIVFQVDPLVRVVIQLNKFITVGSVHIGGIRHDLRDKHSRKAALVHICPLNCDSALLCGSHRDPVCQFRIKCKARPVACLVVRKFEYKLIPAVFQVINRVFLCFVGLEIYFCVCHCIRAVGYDLQRPRLAFMLNLREGKLRVNAALGERIDSLRLLLFRHAARRQSTVIGDAHHFHISRIIGKCDTFVCLYFFYIPIIVPHPV